MKTEFQLIFLSILIISERLFSTHLSYENTRNENFFVFQDRHENVPNSMSFLLICFSKFLVFVSVQIHVTTDTVLQNARNVVTSAHLSVCVWRNRNFRVVRSMCSVFRFSSFSKSSETSFLQTKYFLFEERR